MGILAQKDYRKNIVEKMNARHYKILDLRIAGWAINQIADHLSMTRGQVSIVVNSPIFEHEFALRRARKEETTDVEQVTGEDSVQQALRKGALAAAQKLVTTLKSDNEKNAIRSAAEILDRSGHPKTQRLDGTAGQSVMVIGADELKRLTEALEMDKTKPTERVENITE